MADVELENLQIPLVIGDQSGGNYAQIGTDGTTTLVGTAKIYKQRSFFFNYEKITGQGAPTLVTRGLFSGFTLPVYNADDQQVPSCICMPDDWDGTTDPIVYIGGWLDTANNAKKFNMQCSVETVANVNGTVMPDTTNDYPVETTTGNWGQYAFYKIGFTLDASAIVLAVGQSLAIRIRRLAASGDEIAGNPVVEGAVLVYVANKIGGAT